ncbi:MAG: pentapeptide repeat-containing protein [Bifidobacteriaceae bacterium]|nr:pentapeptide repeat-containing protein [Bifidobacteriaceae bacterium]
MGKRPFLGRNSDATDLVNRIQDNSLVILHGASAVGKSSFLEMELRPALEQHKMTPVVCTSWAVPQGYRFVDSDDLGEDSLRGVDDYIKNLIAANVSLGSAEERHLANRRVYESFSKWVKTCVLVFDQFEEFIREAGDSYERIQGFFKWIQHVTRTFPSKLKIVLSFRSDSYAAVRPLERMVNSHLMSVKELGPVLDEHAIESIIAYPSTHSTWTGVPVAVDDTVAQLLLELWRHKRTSPAAVFELQAALYSLFWEAHDGDDRGGQGIVSGLVEKMLDDSPAASLLGLLGSLRGETHASAVSEISDALVPATFNATFVTKLNHCKNALTFADQSVGEDHLPTDVLTDLAEDHIRRMVPHLSTESHKERRTIWGLLELARSREMGMLCSDHRASQATGDDDLSGVAPRPSSFEPARLTRDQAHGVLDWFWSEENGRRDRILALYSDDALEQGAKIAFAPPAAAAELREAFTLDHLPWLEDPRDMSAGAVLGCQDAEVTVELIRTYLLAVKWLDATNICRVTESSIHLIHDQLGRALRRWTKTPTSSPYPQLESITAVIGDRFVWDVRPSQGRPLGSRGLVETKASPYLANSRIQRSWIDKAHFRDIVFVNCDFRMTRFNECVFENVQFVNCVLDGVLLDECKIVGRPNHDLLDRVLKGDATDDVYEGGVPEFWADGAEDVLRALRYFRGYDGAEDSVQTVLYSLTSGMAATCANRSQVDTTRAGKIVNLGGGLTILGSRVSGLMSRRCRFLPSPQRERVFADDLDWSVDLSDHGELAIAYAAGSSIDFVEMDELRLYLLGCAFRGLSVSRPVAEAEHPTRIPEASFRLFVRQTGLAGPWFGRGLRGAATFDDSTVWGEANLSEDEGMFVLEGDAVMSEERLARLPFGERAERFQKLKDLSGKTDYRSRAAEHELIRRLARERDRR